MGGDELGCMLGDRGAIVDVQSVSGTEGGGGGRGARSLVSGGVIVGSSSGPGGG